MDLGVSGLAFGVYRLSRADRLMEIERAQRQRLLVEQFEMEKQATWYGALRTWRTASQYRVVAPSSEQLFSRGSTITDSDGDDDVAAAAASNADAITTFTRMETAQSNINHQRARSKQKVGGIGG